MKLSFWKKLKKRLRDDSERGARQSVLEELFNDFNRNRFSIYKFNFFRGIFFGLGSVLGGTVVLGLLAWLLNLTGHLVPSVAGFIDHVVELMQTAKK